MNPLFSMNNPMLQALSAMMSGQSPQQFLQSLAQSNPQLKGIDFNNLEQTARNMCRQRGVDIDTAVNQITDKVNSMKK